MPEEAGLTLPLDIPWQLLSRRGPDSPQDPTSLATFVYVPRLGEELDAAYPGDRLIYFKFTASVFPFRLDMPNETPFGVFDEAFAPVWRLVFEVQIRPRGAPVPRGLKPYFLSAAPTRRALIETGVVGDHLTEGESDEVAMSRSGSHLIDGFHSTTKTRNFGVGGAFGLGGLAGGFLPMGGLIGGSYSGSTTAVSSGREVTEHLDATSREASTERRELLSHMTNVNNVLTLLNGSLVGTQSLHFSLWPQPLRPLSVDPNDESLWYAELLKRRSSGIEGMQDFFAVAVVPRGQGFCMTQTLRRVSVFEPPLPEPPVQPSVPFDNFDSSWNDFVKVTSYLWGKYPPGTPLEELDVAVEDRLAPDPGAVPPIPTTIARGPLQAWYDAVGAVWVPNPLPPLPEPQALIPDHLLLAPWVKDAKAVLANLGAAVKIDTVPRPVVSAWGFAGTQAPSMFRLHAVTSPPSVPVAYKWVTDVWLEALDEYEFELAKSPLERGTVLLDERQLDTCASVDDEGVIGDVTATIPAGPGPMVFPPSEMPPGAAFPRWKSAGEMEPRSKGRAMVSSWGLFEAHLSAIAGRSPALAAPLTFQDSRLAEHFLRRAARLTSADPRNERLTDIASRLGIAAAQVKALAAAGVTNLSTLAAAILAAREAQALAHVQQALPDGLDSLKRRALAPELAGALLQAIGRSLDAIYRKSRARPPQPGNKRPAPARRPGRK